MKPEGNSGRISGLTETKISSALSTRVARTIRYVFLRIWGTSDAVSLYSKVH